MPRGAAIRALQHPVLGQGPPSSPAGPGCSPCHPRVASHRCPPLCCPLSSADPSSGDTPIRVGWVSRLEQGSLSPPCARDSGGFSAITLLPCVYAKAPGGLGEKLRNRVTAGVHTSPASFWLTTPRSSVCAAWNGSEPSAARPPPGGGPDPHPAVRMAAGPVARSPGLRTNLDPALDVQQAGPRRQELGVRGGGGCRVPRYPAPRRISCSWEGPWAPARAPLSFQGST